MKTSRPNYRWQSSVYQLTQGHVLSRKPGNHTSLARADHGWWSLSCMASLQSSQHPWQCFPSPTGNMHSIVLKYVCIALCRRGAVPGHVLPTLGDRACVSGQEKGRALSGLVYGPLFSTVYGTSERILYLLGSLSPPIGAYFITELTSSPVYNF